MPYAILVRSPTQPNRKSVLAYDFEEAEQAARFARRLARSYAEHGVSLERNTYWFRDAAGWHELTVA